LERRVVITGVGACYPPGHRRRKNVAGASARANPVIGEITRFDAPPMTTRIAGEVPDFHPRTFCSKKEAKRLELFIAFAIAAARMALEDSGIEDQPRQ
jgi:3-oxoacyl-[acyl-carrier-protein] synthase II